MKLRFLIILFAVFCCMSNLVNGQNKAIKCITSESFSINGNYDDLDSVFYLGDTTFVLKSFESFNQQGKLLSRIEFYSNGNKKTEEQYSYDVKGRLQKLINIDYYGKVDQLEMIYHYEQTDSLSRIDIIDNGELFESIIMKRDSIGNILTQTTLSEGKERNNFKYFYVSNGKLFKVLEFHESGIEYSSTEMRYNSLGQLSEEIKVGEGFGWSCPDTCHNFYFYDSIGNLILAKYNWENESNYYEHRMTYHPNGNVKERRRIGKGCVRCVLETDKYDLYDNLLSRELISDFDNSKKYWYYNYIYDSQGNWILKEETTVNGVKSGMKRTITYY